MSDYVEDDTGSSTRSSSPQFNEEWYVSDLQLAAELGKTLLERNNDLESNLKQSQTVIEEQALEIQFLSRQSAALKDVNDSRVRIYEQLEISVSDLEKTNQKLISESCSDKKRIKSLCINIESLELKCEELQRLVDELKLAERQKKRDRNRTVVPVLVESHQPVNETFRRRFSIENGATVALDSNEDFEMAKLRASVSRLKSQLSKEERKSVDLEAQVNLLLQDNSNLLEQVQLVQEQQEMLTFYHQAERLYWACHKCRHNESEAELEPEDMTQLNQPLVEFKPTDVIDDDIKDLKHSRLSQRNCISLLSELDAQYRAIIEKYEHLLRNRRNSDIDSDSDITSMDHNGHSHAVRSLSEELSEASDLSSGFSESSERSLMDQGVQTETPTKTSEEEVSPVSSHFNHSPPEYRALFQEIFSVLKRSVPDPEPTFESGAGPARSEPMSLQDTSINKSTGKSISGKAGRKFHSKRGWSCHSSIVQPPPFLCASPALVGFPVIRLPGCLSYAEVLVKGQRDSSKRGNNLYKRVSSRQTQY